MIGAWFRSKQREELEQLKIRAEVYFNTAIDQIDVIDKKDVNRFHHGRDLIESVPDRISIKHLFCSDNNFHPVVNTYPYAINPNQELNDQKHYFRKDDYIVIFNSGGLALYSPGVKTVFGKKADTGFML